MKSIAMEIPEVLLLEPRVFRDSRGFFLESYNRKAFAAIGISHEFVQCNHSFSTCGVLRGLHYQIQQAQGKLLRVTQGEIFDVAVDIRLGSPTFGKWVGAILSSQNLNMLWIPPGFAHGFLVLSATADVQYQATDYYAPAHERTLLWNDPAVNIQWPALTCANAPAQPILSDKDRVGKLLKDAEVYP